jgi:hypothetical protein
VNYKCTGNVYPTKEYTVFKSCIAMYDITFLAHEDPKKLKFTFMSIYEKRKEEKVLYLLNVDV